MSLLKACAKILHFFEMTIIYRVFLHFHKPCYCILLGKYQLISYFCSHNKRFTKLIEL